MPYKKILISITLLMLFFFGCQYPERQLSKETPLVPKIKKMVVFGFRPAMFQGEEPNIIRTSLSGAVFMAEPVSQNVVDKMSTNLFKRLLEDKRYDLISPSQAKGVFLSLVTADLTSNDMEIFQKIGQTFSADAVLTGFVYRWRDREGTDYAVDRPASVAFDLYLIRPTDGAILWKGRFDKTQKSLSENLLDMDTFIKGGGKWMSAEKLAKLGLEGLLAQFLKSGEGAKD